MKVYLPIFLYKHIMGYYIRLKGNMVSYSILKYMLCSRSVGMKN